MNTEALGFCVRRDVTLDHLRLPHSFLFWRLLLGVKWWMAFCPGITFTSSGGEAV
jgi:hypothetical protein